MRLVTIGLLAATVWAGACNRTEATAAAAAAPGDKPTATAPAADTKTAEPEAARGAAVREVTIPAGTHIPITLDSSVGSDTSRVEQPVAAHVSRAIVIGGRTAIPAGARVNGVVTDATRSGKVKGLAHVSVRFDTLTDEGEKYRIGAAAIGRTAPATKKQDAAKIGGGAAGGALIGAIAGGKKGAAIGTLVGGGAGTAVVMSTRGKEVRLPKGSALTLRLSEPLTVRIRG